MSNDRHVDTDYEVRRLEQQADHLDLLGKHEQAIELRKDAVALASAEAQRLSALADAHRQVTYIQDALQRECESWKPQESDWWFIRHSPNTEVARLRNLLEIQHGRIVILEEGAP